jgi:hypothetical protein
MKKTALAVAMGIYLTGCTSAEQKQDYRDAQVQIIGAQVSGRTEEGKADAAARAALYAAMAEVARNAPDSADAIAVALAISSVKEEADSSGAIVQLHREQNEAVELTKAIAPALIGAVSTVAVAGYQASVSKNNSDNAALVALGDSAADADIMRSVTDMATAGLSQSSISVGGDYTTVGNDMDQSVTTTSSTSSTTTESSSVSTVTDSYNETTYTTTDGTNVSLEDIEALLGAGLRVTVVIDGEEVEVTQCAETLTFGGGC